MGFLASPMSEAKDEVAAVFCVRRRSGAIFRSGMRTSGVKTSDWDGGGGEGMRGNGVSSSSSSNVC
jgi:hypothetical protein